MKHLWIGFSCIAAIFLALAGLTAYAVRLSPQLNHQAKPVMDAFYVYSQKHQYAQAQALFTPQLQSSISVKDVQERWLKFEKQHGALNKFTPAGGQPGAVNLFPRFVDYDYLVLGKEGHGTRIFVRLVPQGNEWRIEKLSLFS